MYDTLVQHEIQKERVELEKKLTKLNMLQNQSEVFTLGLLWDQLFEPVYELIQAVQSEIPAGEWNITNFAFISGDKYYMSIDMEAHGNTEQFVFDEFLARFANSKTVLDINRLDHTEIYKLDRYTLILDIKIPTTDAVKATLYSLGKIKTQVNTSEYLSCDIPLDDSIPF